MNKTSILKSLALMSAIAVISSCGSTLEELHETVTIDGAVGALVGNVDRPVVKSDKCPVAIIYHGLTGNRSEAHLLAVADSLYNEGVAVVRFDFNGHGESEGLFSNMDLNNELEDAKIIYDYVCSLPWADKKNIILSGHSQGGLIAGVAAADLGKDKVKSLILMAPAACIHNMCVEGSMFSHPFDVNNLPDSLEFWGGEFLGKSYLQSGIDMDVLERTSGYDGPVCILQGGSDSNIIGEASKYPSYLKDCEYHEMEGLTHCFGEDLALPAKISAEFVRKQLGK